MTLFTTIALVVLISSIVLLFHTYLGIYLSLALFVRRKKPAVTEVGDDQLPTSTVLIPAYNEELFIGKLVENISAQNYPPDKLKIIVGSDQSTDRTDEIVQSFDPTRVTLFRMPERGGKSKIMDTVIPTVTSEVVIIIDANVQCQPETLRRLVERFVNPAIGCVGGRIILKPPKESRNVELESSYRDYEITLKRLMSQLGVVIGLYGGLYAFRQVAFKPIHRGTGLAHDDVIIPLDIMGEGYRVEFAEQAIAYEETNPSIRGEFRRRVRMTAYNLNSVIPTLRQSFHAGMVAGYVALSYKVIRWFAPFIWGLLTLAVFSLLFIHPIVNALAGVILAGILLALIGWLFDLAGKRMPIATACYHFAAMNIASYIGLKGWLTGGKSYWTPRG